MARRAAPQEIRRYLPLPLGGQFSSGDASTIPLDACRLVRNFLHRPGERFDARPPFVYDGLMAVTGLLTWEDLASQVTRFGSISGGNLRFKDAGAETWGDAIPGDIDARLTSFTTYRGNLYMMFDDGAGNPYEAWKWDGVTLTLQRVSDNPFSPANRPFNSLIASRGIVSYKDRLFLLAPRITVAPYNGGGALSPTVTAYDWTDPAVWTATNVDVRMITLASGVQVCRLTPTSTAAEACEITGPNGLLNFSAHGSDQQFTWRGGFRGVDATYDVPCALELFISTLVATSTNYAIGDLVSSGGILYRCIVGGLSAAIAPTYLTTGTTVDGGVTWLAIGSNVIASSEAFGTPFTQVPSISAEPNYLPMYLTCTIPPRTNTVAISARFKFWNSSTPALAKLAAVDISLKDGLSDTNPAKANEGQQWTVGDFAYPFFNKESAITRTLDLEDIIDTETSLPRQIRAVNTTKVQEEAGPMQVGVVVADRLLAYKRRALWTFNGTDDPDIPILPESFYGGAGAIGPLALDVLDDEVFTIAEFECNRMRVGSAPVPFCGDAMREEIMARGASWVENQPIYNMPILACDRKNRDVYVYTQRGKIFVYHLPTSQWSVLDVAQNGSIDVQAMVFNPVTGEMEIAFGGHGLARLDPTIYGVLDTIDDSLVYTSSAQVTGRPIEFPSPRYQAIVEEIAPFHTIERLSNGLYATQLGQLSMGVSYDRGVTFPNYTTVTFNPADSPRIPLWLQEFGVSITPGLIYTGPLGAQSFAISRWEAVLQVFAEEVAQVLPSAVGSSL